MVSGPHLARRLSWILIVLAVGLIVAHFVLDAGDGQEAPGWILIAGILIAGILIAASATVVAATSRKD